MMHRVILLCSFFVLSLASTSFAHSFPNTLHCSASEANEQARDFFIFDLNTSTPRTDIDAKSEGVSIDPVTTRFCANNGCDNDYCFVFFTEDLSALKAGKTTQVKGLMRYLNSSSPINQEQPLSVALTCTLP